MSAQFKPDIMPGYYVTEGSRVERVISVAKEYAVLRPVGVGALDKQDTLVPLDDLYAKIGNVDFGISPGEPDTAVENGPKGNQRKKLIDLGLNDQHQVMFVYCACHAIDDVRADTPGKVTEAWCEANWSRINSVAEEHFLKLSGQKKKGKRQKVSYTAPCAKVLARDYAGYLSNHLSPDDHAPQRSRAGRKPKEIPDWAYAIILAGLKPHLDDREPDAIDCFGHITGALIEENQRRAIEDILHKPYRLSRWKFYEIVGELKPSDKQARRLGLAELRSTLQTGLPELRAFVYGEIIQIDEYEMPLWVFLEKTGLHVVVGAKTMDQLRKEAENTTAAKVWLLAARDVATGRTVAFNLSRSQNAEDTLELLRRLVSDTTQLAKEAGCENLPPPPVRPQVIIMDTGPGFWNSTVPLAILSLGASFKFGRAKSPKDKASIESSFGSIGKDLMKRLHGYNGAGPGKQPGYDGRAMAVMSMAQIEQILWWYFTDCVPFKQSQRRASLGTVNHVAFARTLKRFGLLPPLARRDVRRALGLRVTRTVTTMGIEVFRMPFQGQPDFRAWSIDNIGEKVTVYIDPHRIEEVTVVTGDGKSFYLKAGLSQFRHFSLQDWRHFLEEWRHTDPVSDEINAMALYRFYLRVSDRMADLLEFHGKEHKVLRQDEVQSACDMLAGGSLRILPDDTEGSASVDRQDIFKSKHEGPGTFKPGDIIPDEDEDPVRNVGKKSGAGAKGRPPKKFTGDAKGKGKLL